MPDAPRKPSTSEPTTTSDTKDPTVETVETGEAVEVDGVEEPEESVAVVREAHEAIDAGRLWVARDVLAAHLREERDVEALRLLGEVHHGMGDLPAAGAVWFGAGVKGPEVEAAVEAWRDAHGDDFGAMWRSLPRSVRQEPRSKKVEALRAKALEARDATDAAASVAGPGAGVKSSRPASANGSSGGLDAAQIIAWIIAAFVVVCAVVGLVQILRWMVPGT
ncbi:hypothetical protein N802_03105 [Knoellia sinensis KCTC 19936]|uniref:Uncharacterized protein n=1 Tax=Knoellia sinensis KCTC 19936 TaxID=1385520 RepID=A0A0A0J2V2_9MICO|nr:hypothetical protein [Knoellia sinensis]KGN31730.1 hypothetical protein N802_03105 [Knoellia sinensis KCTC 19936]